MMQDKEEWANIGFDDDAAADTKCSNGDDNNYAPLCTDPDEGMLDNGGLLEGFPTTAISDSDDDDDSEEGAIGSHRNITNGENDDDNDRILRPGDHVYVWQSYGVPRAFQRHGIILSVDNSKSTHHENGFEFVENDLDGITVVSFYHRDSRDRQASDSSRNNNNRNSNSGSRRYFDENDDDSTDEFFGGNLDGGGDVGGMSDESLLNDGVASARQHSSIAAGVKAETLRMFIGKNGKNKSDKEKAKLVHKVKYGSSLARRLLSRAGTVTACVADNRPLIVARARFLLDNPTQLPEHHVLSANAECVAVWCRIGRFITLQGSTILQIMFVGQAGGAVAGGVIASSTYLWAPMTGAWGAAGWWWYVPATVAYPFLIPVLVTFGLASLLPLELLRRYRKKWKVITEDMNRTFWLKTDDEIRQEHFASTAQSDENDLVKKFFGMRDDEKDEADRGSYMPLNVENDDIGDADGDDDEDDLLFRHEQNVAASYKMEGQQDWDLREQMQEMMKKWGSGRNNSKSKIRADLSDHIDSDGMEALTTSQGEMGRGGGRRRSSFMNKLGQSLRNISNKNNKHSEETSSARKFIDYTDENICNGNNNPLPLLD